MRAADLDSIPVRMHTVSGEYGPCTFTVAFEEYLQLAISGLDRQATADYAASAEFRENKMVYDLRRSGLSLADVAKELGMGLETARRRFNEAKRWHDRFWTPKSAL